MVAVRWTVLVPVGLLALVLWGLAPSVWAHPGFGPTGMASEPLPMSARPATPPLSTLTASPAPWRLSELALVVALLGSTVAWRGRRRAIALTLVPLLAILVYQGGLHSVHHGTVPQAAESCPILAASHHIVGTETETSDLPSPTVLVVVKPGFPVTDEAPADHVPRSDQGRAPPVSPSR